MKSRRFFLYASAILLFILSASPNVVAEGGRVSQEQPAKGAGLVTVDFRVVGNGGVQILDLKPAEVSLKVGGRARDLRLLELVRHGGGQVAADGTAIAPLAPPFASNHPADRGRNVILMVEDASIPPGREETVREAVGALLDNLSGRDAVSLLIISRGKFDVGQTTQHDSVRAVLGKFVGGATQSETVDDAACRTLQALNALKGIVGGLAGGMPTTIVFLSGGLTWPASGGAKLKWAAGTMACEVRQELFNEIATNAQRASVDLYTVQIPTELVGSTTGAETVAGIENLAGVAGNALIRLSGNQKTEMARVARETSAYYLASFEPDPAERTGSAARVELRVSRENAKVRAPSEITIAKEAAASADAKGPVARDMLRVATVYRDLWIRAVACPGRDPGDKDLKLAVMFEPFEVGLPFTSASIGLFDDKGKLTAQWTAQPADLGALPVMAGFKVKPGTYRMRVAATDGSGRRGTVDQNVTVELNQGDVPVQMSGLILGAPAGKAFGPKLLYQTEEKALGYFEVYGVPKTATVTAAIEIAQSASGPAVATAPAGVGAPGSDGRRVVLGEIPIGSLRPGDHLVRIVVSVDGKPVGHVVRTLRKTGK